MYAPYMPHMRLGQGYNSYLQETCLESAVEVLEVVEDGQSRPPQPTRGANHMPETKIRWTISDEQNQLENAKNLMEWQGISPAAVIKNGLLSPRAAASYLDKYGLKESHHHSQFGVSVSIKQQPRNPHKDFRFHPLSSETPPDRTVYGDCFISDFIEGGEFYGSFSMKEEEGLTPEETQAKSAGLALRIGNYHARGEISVATKKMSEIIARSVSSVFIRLNGCDAKNANPWTLEDLQRITETFGERVKENPSKTFAVLTPYKNIRRFHECEPGFVPLDYSRIAAETDQMFGAYLKYEKIKLELQRRIRDDPVAWGGLEALEGVVEACDEQLEVIRKNVYEAAANPEGGARRYGYIKPSDFEQKMIPAQVPVNLYIRWSASPNRVIFDFARIGTTTSTGGWCERHTIKVFKYPAPNTIKVSVGFLTDPDRAMVFTKQNESLIEDGWKINLHFYAYESEQPNSRLVTICHASNPWRCENAFSINNSHGWAHRLAFWVPV